MGVTTECSPIQVPIVDIELIIAIENSHILSNILNFKNINKNKCQTAGGSSSTSCTLYICEKILEWKKIFSLK